MPRPPVPPALAPLVVAGLALGVVLPLAACGPQPTPANQAANQLGPAYVAPTARGVDAIEAAWNADLAARNPAKAASHYSTFGDLLVAEPGVAPLKDPAAVQAQLTQLFADPNFSLSFAPDVTFVSSGGDYAYTRGHFTETLSDAAAHAKKTIRGDYVTVYEADVAVANGWTAIEHVASAQTAALAPGS